MKALWEILVPTEKRIKTPKPTLHVTSSSDFIRENDDYQTALNTWEKKNAYTTRFHRVWDEKVRAITGGLTIMSPVKGQWASQDGELFKERMIPVRIVATREEIDCVIDLTMLYYDQLAILCYKLSDEVILKYRELE